MSTLERSPPVKHILMTIYRVFISENEYLPATLSLRLNAGLVANDAGINCHGLHRTAQNDHNDKHATNEPFVSLALTAEAWFVGFFSCFRTSLFWQDEEQHPPLTFGYAGKNNICSFKVHHELPIRVCIARRTSRREQARTFSEQSSAQGRISS